MKVTLLGTSYGVPQKTRRCTCDMIETDNGVYFVDMGLTATEELIKRDIPVDSVKGVFITHCHGDHINGLPQFLDLCNWQFKTADPTIIIPKQDSLDAMRNWVFSNDGSSPLRDITTRVTTPGETYNDGYLKVTAIPTQHIIKSYAYFIECEGKKLLFTGDLKHPNIDFPEIAFSEEIDLLVCECSHFSPLNYIPIFEKCKIKEAVIAHVNPERQEDLDILCEKMNVTISHDNIEFTL